MDQKISQLNQATTITDADVLPIVNSAETKKVTVNTLKTNIRTGLALTTYVDSQDALKVDKIAGKGLSTEDYTSTEKTKLGTIQSGAEVNVNADWNAVSGDAEILNKPTIPNEITLTSELTNDGSDGSNPFITALDIPIYGQAGTLVREVKNMTGATLTKGTVVYISGANGNKPLVSKALATTDALSARTFGLLQSDISNNGLGFCVVIGDLSGLDTSSFTEGAQLYLSGTVAGTYTSTKTLAPTHLVYVGKVTRSHHTQGQIEVGIQNGYELEEIHDVQIISPLNNQTIFYDSADQLWKNKPISDILGYTPYRFVTATQSIGSNASGETQLIRVTIPANSFASEDKFRFKLFLSKVGALNATTVRIKLSTSSTMPIGATNQIATSAIGNTALYCPTERTMGIVGGNLKGFNFTSSNVIDTATLTTAISSVAFDVTQTQYLYVSATPAASTTDVSYLEYLEITN